MCPQRETRGCNEILFCSWFSFLGISMNIVSTFYNYFIAYHPIATLLCYIFAYFLLSSYIFKLGKMIINMNKVIKEEHPIVTQTDYWMQNDLVPIPKRRSTHTQKTTQLRYQKGKQKFTLQGIRKGKQIQRQQPPVQICPNSSIKEKGSNLINTNRHLYTSGSLCWIRMLVISLITHVNIIHAI